MKYGITTSLVILAERADTLSNNSSEFFQTAIFAQDIISFKNFSINVLDENDSPPNITLPGNCVQITEFHDMKEVISSIRGKDSDDPASPNGQIKYEIIDGSGAEFFFLKQIDHLNAVVLANRPLNGLYGNYSLIIMAKDLGVPQNIVEKQLDICIQDFNDHAPVFVSPSNNFTIRVPEVRLKTIFKKSNLIKKNLFRILPLEPILSKFLQKTKTWVQMQQ